MNSRRASTCPVTSTSGSISSLVSSSEAKRPSTRSTSFTIALTRVRKSFLSSSQRRSRVSARQQLRVCFPVAVCRRRRPGRHRQRDGAQSPGGHHQQLRTDSVPAAEGKSHFRPSSSQQLDSSRAKSSGLHPGTASSSDVGRERHQAAGPPGHRAAQHL